MSPKSLSWALAGCVVLVASATAEPGVDAESVLAEARVFFRPLPERIEGEGVRLTPERIALGQKLYFDPRLSRSGRISCNNCHNITSAGVDNLPKAIGHRGAEGPRNAPTTWNAAVHVRQFWDGRAENVESQALHPIINPLEMALTPREAVERLASIPEYRKLFAAAFPDDDPSLTYRNIGVAIGAYERTMTTPSRFDRFLRGDIAALDDKELRGLRAFMSMGCLLCHNGVGIGGATFRKFGVFQPYWEFTNSKAIDQGLFAITGDETDRYVFKVPSLRNVTRTYPYFHDGSVRKLEDAVRIMGTVQLNNPLRDSDIESIVIFLKALEGELPEQARVVPVLPASKARTPRPTP